MFVRKWTHYYLWLLPIWLRTIIVYLIGGFSLLGGKDPSQFGEGRLLYNFLKEKKVRGGTYLDVGCYHPILLSNTFLLHKSGWQGTAVDISAEKLAAMKFSRGSKVKTVLCAIVPKKDVGNSMNVYNFKKLWSEIDTVLESVAVKKKLEKGYNYTCSSVPTMSLDSFLDKRIDVLNIDIEGLDTAVISSIPVEILPDTILYESDGDGDVLGRGLKKSGFVKVFETGKTVCVSRL